MIMIHKRSQDYEDHQRLEKKWKVKLIHYILIKYGTFLNYPVDGKIIGSKWMFKRKYDADRHMEQHKAWLVAQRTVRC